MVIWTKGAPFTAPYMVLEANDRFYGPLIVTGGCTASSSYIEETGDIYRQSPIFLHPPLDCSGIAYCSNDLIKGIGMS